MELTWKRFFSPQNPKSLGSPPTTISQDTLCIMYTAVEGYFISGILCTDDIDPPLAHLRSHSALPRFTSCFYLLKTIYSSVLQHDFKKIVGAHLPPYCIPLYHRVGQGLDCWIPPHISLRGCSAPPRVDGNHQSP